MRKVSGLEAVYRDYASKKVQFYFVYKALAHPERSGILQPVTLEERLTQARAATKRLGNTIPFLVDAIDNRLKHALGDRNNSEFIVGPDLKIVRKRTWSDPEQVRKDLEELVGKAETFTKAEDVVLKVEPAPADAAAKGVVQKVSRMGMTPIVAAPRVEKGVPFYAKLRAEADPTVIEAGKGKLYLGFHLDPFHNVHWNNEKQPLRYKLEVPEGVKLSETAGESAKSKVETDVDPREFLLTVESWPRDKTVRLTVTYAACTATDCHEVSQVYELRPVVDRDGGRRHERRRLPGPHAGGSPQAAARGRQERGREVDQGGTPPEPPAPLRRVRPQQGWPPRRGRTQEDGRADERGEEVGRAVPDTEGLCPTREDLCPTREGLSGTARPTGPYARISLGRHMTRIIAVIALAAGLGLAMQAAVAQEKLPTTAEVLAKLKEKRDSWGVQRYKLKFERGWHLVDRKDLEERELLIDWKTGKFRQYVLNGCGLETLRADRGLRRGQNQDPIPRRHEGGQASRGRSLEVWNPHGPPQLVGFPRRVLADLLPQGCDRRPG